MISEQVFLGGAPVIGFGESVMQSGVDTSPTTASAGLPWGEIVASSVVSAVAGLALDGIVRAARKGR